MDGWRVRWERRDRWWLRGVKMNGWYLSSICPQPNHGPWCYQIHDPNPEWQEDYESRYTGWWQGQKYLRDRDIKGGRKLQICVDPARGPWCEFKEHPKGKAHFDPTRCFNSVSSELAANNSHAMLHNALSEEIEVVNAVYGPGTLVVLFVEDTKVRLRLELPTNEPMIFWLDLEHRYPNTIPTIKQAGLTLHQSMDRRTQNIYLVLFTTLQKVFESGSACLYNLIDDSLSIVACLQGYSFDTALSEVFAPEATMEEWQWTHKPFINMTDAIALVECVICCDEFHAYKLILAPCKHDFCLDCFADGWNVVREEAEPYACCLKRIPFETIKSCLAVTQETESRYKRLLKEKDTANAFFCGYKYCREFIGSFTKWELSRGKTQRNGIFCKFCQEKTCAKCREHFHPGPCGLQDEAFRELVESDKIRRCPKCGYMWEKAGGCRHVSCPCCRAQWWWKRDGTLEDYTLHMHRLHFQEEDEEQLGLLFDDQGEAYRMQEAPMLTEAEAAPALDRLEALRLEQEQGNQEMPEEAQGDFLGVQDELTLEVVTPQEQDNG